MSGYDIANIFNLAGLVLAIAFWNPFSRRAPPNRALGALGFVLMLVAAVYLLWLRFSV